MRKLRLKLVATILACGLLVAPAAAFAQTTQESLHDIDHTLSAAVTRATFIQANTIDELKLTFASQYPDLETALSHAHTDFSASGDAAKNATFKKYANQFAQASEDMDKGLRAMKSAYDANDDAKLTSAGQAFGDGLNSYQDTADKYNTYVQDHPEESGDSLLHVYLGLLIASALISFGALAFWLRTGAVVGDTLAQQLRKLRQQIFIVSLLPLLGSAVTYFWYRYTITHNGGTYYVLYGPVIFGFIVFFQQLIGYRKTVKRIQAGPASPIASIPTPPHPPTASSQPQ